MNSRLAKLSPRTRKTGALAGVAAATLAAASVVKSMRRSIDDPTLSSSCMCLIPDCEQESAFKKYILSNMENATWRILSNEAVQFRRNSLTTEARRRLARLTVYGRDLINSLHRYIEITLPEIERTLTLGFAVRPENKPQDKGRKGPEKVFLEIQDPTVSLIYSGKKDNYLYPGQGKHSCRVQAHVLTNLEELNTQQVEFFKEAIQKSHCYSKGTANILEISVNNSRFSWLAYHLQRKLDPQRQGACLNCIYFTELFKDYPRNLTSILSQSSSSNFEGASGANQNLASF